MGAFEEAVKKKEAAIKRANFLDQQAGTPAEVSMRYGSMTDAEEQEATKPAIPAPAPVMPPATPVAPQANVRGVPGEMTAEYYAPADKAEPAPLKNMGPSPAEIAAIRLRKARAELQRLDEVKNFYRAAGLGIGTAIGAGLGGPPGAAAGALIGTEIGWPTAAEAAGDFRPSAGPYSPTKYQLVQQEVDAAQEAISKGLRDGSFTEEEMRTAMDSLNL